MRERRYVVHTVDLLSDLARAKAALMQLVDRLQHYLLFGHLYQLLASLAARLDLFVPESIRCRSADCVAA